MRTILSLFVFLFVCSLSNAQDTTKWYDHFNLDGYIQVQGAFALGLPDSLSLHSPSAGNFRIGSSNKFSVRRGRIQVGYQKKNIQASFSFDVNETGFHAKDSWLAVHDPWWNALTLTSGVFTRRFGSELEWSSQDRETPERSLVVQHLFPGVRDIGFNIGFQPDTISKLHFLKLDAGIFHGTSANQESDGFKDFTGRLMIDKPLKNNVFDFSFGASAYFGKVRHQYDIDGSASNYKFVWETVDTTMTIGANQETFTIMRQDVNTSELNTILGDTLNPISIGTYSKALNKLYWSINTEFFLSTKIGETSIRGAYFGGNQISQEGTLANPYVFTSYSPTGPFTSVTWPKYDSPQPYNPATVSQNLKPSHSFNRKFSGWYAYLTQKIGKTGHNVIFRADYYDPNLDVSGDRVGVNVYDSQGNLLGSSGLSVADVAFTTLGFGYQYEFNDDLSLLLYYEHPMNEITQIEPLDGTLIGQGKYPHSGYLDDADDDVLLFRIQYKF